jgi:UDP-2,3-diacylglucosamine pyrophosphatase LpxH
MTFAFDLISDLHVETWDPLDWTGRATSPYCIVAGDVAREHTLVADTLQHLGECYQGVFYIDGNDEHRHSLEDIGYSYQSLTQIIKPLNRVVYMQDNVVIINGVAILATNGWWTYDFDLNLDYEQTMAWYRDRVQCSEASSNAITGIAYHDAAYLINSVHKLQTHQDVKSIVIVSHTVPASWIIDHDIDLVDTWRYNCMGNPHLQSILDEDTEHKIKTWCFGHYHKGVDRDYNGVRYVNNCRGRGDTPWKQAVYHPKRIEIQI